MLPASPPSRRRPPECWRSVAPPGVPPLAPAVGSAGHPPASPCPTRPLPNSPPPLPSPSSPHTPHLCLPHQMGAAALPFKIWVMDRGKAFSLYGVVEPLTGEYMIQPYDRVNTENFQHF